ncbi:MAG: hypothetical protein PQJ60_09225 [Spirochaetales bacterium]|nr:hypothetical protein [Spirochaetales bacterium]
MKKALFLLILASLFYSCSSMTDNVVQSVDDQDFRETIFVYDELIRFYLDLPLESSPEELEKKLEDLLAVESFNKDFQVRTLALNALWNQLQGRGTKAKSLLGEAEEIGRQEELIYIVRSLDSKTPTLLLEEGLEKLYMTTYLPLFLGEAYFREGEFGKGGAYFEMIPDEAPLDIQHHAHKRIEECLTLYQSGAEGTDGIELLTKENLRLSEMVSLFESQTDLFASFRGDSDEETWENWKTSHILKEGDSPELILLRRKLADILYRISYYEEGKGEPPVQESYLEQLGESPISDVPLNDPDFPAIILVIEREWINMINGEDFYPNQEVSGQDLIPLLKKLNDYYSF